MVLQVAHIVACMRLVNGRMEPRSTGDGLTSTENRHTCTLCLMVHVPVLTDR